MTIGPLTEIQASVIYLIPVVVALLWWSQRQASLAEVALWIPTAVALDILGTLLLSWVMPLDGALITTRVVWLALGALWLWRRRWRLEWPPRVTRGQLAVIGATALASFALSACISRPGSLWDRQFHVPLVSMLRGQRLPFLTVFQSNKVLHFHFAGDIVSAALQTFSFGRMHASLALALTHDLMFVLAGVSLAAWVVAISRPLAWVIPGVLAVFLSGPFALQRVGLGPIIAGYSYLNLYCMSYRPAISLAILLLVGAFAAIGLRVDRGTTTRPHALVALLACIAVLAITDEPSAALLGIGMAALWVARPETLYRSRVIGLLVLAIGALAIIVPNLLFQAALVPGGPVQKLHLVPFRSPGFAEGPLPLTTKRGLYALATDLAPYVLILLALAGAAWREYRSGRAEPRPGDGGTRTMAIVLGAILLVATLALTTIDLNGQAIENHRFMTICEVVFPVAALLLLARLPTGRWERTLLVAALLIPAVSTWYWAEYGVGAPDDWFTNSIDCRASAGGGLFDRPRPTYVPQRSLYAFSGCRAAFVPGSANNNDWAGVLFNGYAAGGKGAFQILHNQFVGPQENLRAACPVHPTQPDALCDYAQSRTQCLPAGSDFRLCELTPADRTALVSMAW